VAADHTSLQFSRMPQGGANNNLMASTASYRAQAQGEDSSAYQGLSEGPSSSEDQVPFHPSARADGYRDRELEAASVRRASTSPTVSPLRPPSRSHLSNSSSTQRGQQKVDSSRDRQRLERVLSSSKTEAEEDQWQDGDRQSPSTVRRSRQVDDISTAPPSAPDFQPSKRSNVDDGESSFSFGIQRNVAPGTSWLHEARSISSDSRSLRRQDASTQSSAQQPPSVVQPTLAEPRSTFSSSHSNSRSSAARQPTSPEMTPAPPQRAAASGTWLESQIRSVEEAETTRDLSRLEVELQRYLTSSRGGPPQQHSPKRQLEGEYDADADSDAYSDVPIVSAHHQAPSRASATVPYGDKATPNWRQSPATPYMPGYLRGLNTPAATSSSRRRENSVGDEPRRPVEGTPQNLASPRSFSTRSTLPAETPHPPGYVRPTPSHHLLASQESSAVDRTTSSPLRAKSGRALVEVAPEASFARELALSRERSSPPPVVSSLPRRSHSSAAHTSSSSLSRSSRSAPLSRSTGSPEKSSRSSTSRVRFEDGDEGLELSQSAAVVHADQSSVRFPGRYTSMRQALPPESSLAVHADQSTTSVGFPGGYSSVARQTQMPPLPRLRTSRSLSDLDQPSSGHEPQSLRHSQVSPHPVEAAPEEMSRSLQRVGSSRRPLAIGDQSDLR
jgi:hypothetical protein